MKERLIELLDKKQVCGWKYVVDDYTTDVFNEDIADYLLANGVIVLPCAVGDTVYIVTEVSRAVIECIVLGAWVCEDNCTIITHDGTIHSASFGKTVFLTKEEAVKALERSEGK